MWHYIFGLSERRRNGEAWYGERRIVELNSFIFLGHIPDDGVAIDACCEETSIGREGKLGHFGDGSGPSDIHQYFVGAYEPHDDFGFADQAEQFAIVGPLHGGALMSIGESGEFIF